jgi:isopenicillin N synthase-like dioxygenase
LIGSNNQMPSLPIVDVASLTRGRSALAARATVARALDAATRRHGFFEGTNRDYVTAKVGKVGPELKQRVAGG